MFWDLETCGILAPRPGIEPAPTPLEDEVLTTEPSGKVEKGREFFMEFFDVFPHEMF